MQLEGVTIQWQEMAEGRSLVTRAAPTELTWSTENVIENNDKLNANQLGEWHFPFTPFLPLIPSEEKKEERKKVQEINQKKMSCAFLLGFKPNWIIFVGTNDQHFIL